MLALLALLAPVAEAEEPTLRIEAWVEADGTVRGLVTPAGLEQATWIDPLAALPSPTDELERVRTFPGLPDVGEVQFVAGPTAFPFRTRLPSRWEDVGATGFGVFANGAWYPQPLLDGLPVLTLDVEVHGPSGHLVVVGDQHGEGTVRWQGRADRASLAVLPRGVATAIGGPGFAVDLITSGRPRRALVRHLTEQLSLATLEGARTEGAVVEAPLRRRLARPGAGLTYVSDRAWRVFPGFYRLHHRGVVRAVAAGSSGHADAWSRELVGAARARIHDQRLVRKAAVDLLGLTRWIPLVDAALYTREMAFQAELFKRVGPTDPAADDLAERFAPAAPGPLVLAQLADAFGPELADRFAADVGAGVPIALAASRAGLPATWLDAWRVPYPSQDYRLSLEDRQVVVTREAPAEAPSETVVIAVDGDRRTWTTTEGPDRTAFLLEETPRRVLLDPDRHTLQTTRTGDLRPPPVRWTLWGQLSSVNVGEGFVNAYATLGIRRADDTHNAFRITLLTSQRAWITGRFAWTWYGGRLVQPTVRAHAVTVGADGAWLNPRFSPLGAAQATVGGTLAWSWDNRESILFPRRGARTSFAASAGGAPETGQSYVRVTGSVAGQLDPHPRHILAGRVSTGIAATDIPQERLSFGGFGGVRGLPDDAVQTEAQVTASIEYRGVPLHQGSLPLGPFWLRDIHLIGGLDLGVAEADGAQLAAIGGVLGAGVIVDNLGLSPGAATLTFAWPITTSGVLRPEGALPFELYLTWGVTF